MWYISNALLTSTFKLFLFVYYFLCYLDSADDLFTQQPKKSSKKGAKKDAKKDAIESVFDNDSDDFLDSISKSSTSSDTGGDKNGPSGPPDNTLVDMVSMCICCLVVCIAYMGITSVFVCEQCNIYVIFIQAY